MYAYCKACVLTDPEEVCRSHRVLSPEGKTMRQKCHVCCHQCMLDEGQTGACGARTNTGGMIRPSNYGRLTALALDPIEKKPLARFYPGSRILSVGSYGCSLRCPFCQNYEIATAREKAPGAGSSGRGRGGREKAAVSAGAPAVTYRDHLRERRLETGDYSPQDLCDLALGLRDRGNIGIAFTYNEPLVGWEFVRDTAEVFHRHGMKTVMVTNGMASLEVLEDLLPHIDAMNIDLKGFSESFYRDFVGGDLEMVKAFIRRAAQKCHVELTKLIIPGKNDSEEEMRRMAAWIASLDTGPEGGDAGGGLKDGHRAHDGRGIPLHVSRYFPRYRWTEPATKVETVYRLAKTAREYLDHVYTGNC